MKKGISADKAPVQPQALAELLQLISKGDHFWQDCQIGTAGNVDDWQISRTGRQG
jgi:hypothetical protein